MSAGPLSCPKKDKAYHAMFDTSEKRENATSAINTGKTAQSHRRQRASAEQLIAQGGKLAKRVKAWQGIKDAEENGFHRPGSSKK